MRGIAYGVGVGPGDPEQMTLKAVALVKENEVFAVPGKDPREAVAYQIAVQAVPELAEKNIFPIYMPMVRDRKVMEENHRKGARLIEEYLDQGKNVVYLTLGDSTIYCTFTYLQAILEEDGYQTQLINGISSFSAAAARLNMPLVEWDEALHIIPAVHKGDEKLDQPGNYVLMKSASHMKKTKALLAKSNREVAVVENCGMPDEMIYRSVEEIPDDAGYFSLVIAKEKRSRE
ncbi:MAG: precorrin-2 C(20)-methyltransferase [Lachnospiraceae bacterium]|nr:precorrin-2 C(20)-methyltransferase [Lachnospiraceae bacterium]